LCKTHFLFFTTKEESLLLHPKERVARVYSDIIGLKEKNENIKTILILE
jgi:hypothetical protein